MGYLLGVDAGLTVIKASLLDPAGAEIARAGVPAPAALPRPGAAERDLDVLWAATVQAVDACLTGAGVTGREVDAVGVTGHGDGIYLVDAAHRPVGPAILSTDTRGAARAAAVGTGRSAATLLRRAGELPRRPQDLAAPRSRAPCTAGGRRAQPPAAAGGSHRRAVAGDRATVRGTDELRCGPR